MTGGMMDGSCSDFAAALAAKTSVPGGGGAAAYVGALAAALCQMVGNFTAGKERYACYEDDVQRMLAEADRVRERLLALVDEDAQAFYPLSQAYGIPKDDPSRAATLERCTKDAIAAPLEMMRQAACAVELLGEMGRKGSRMLLSDVGCGAALAAAALRAASINVFVNTAALADRAFAERAEAEADGLLAQASRADELAAEVAAAVRGA